MAARPGAVQLLARGPRAQVAALGPTATALLNVATALAEANVKLVPEVLVNGGNGGRLDGLVAARMKPRNGQTLAAGAQQT
jgi:hypothetical protein